MNMTTGKIPFFLAVDVEPDQHVDVGLHGPASWSGVEVIRRHLREARSRLEDATGSDLRVGWYLRMDPQIEALSGNLDQTARLFGEALAESASTGSAYLGLHVHATRWHDGEGSWVADTTNPDVWLEHLRVGLDAFKDSMGVAPLRHRFTRGLTSTDMLTALGQAGVRVDLTPESSPIRYFRRPPSGPYRPAGATATKTPWVIPASSWTPSWSRHAGGVWSRSRRRLRWGPFARWHLTPFARSLSPDQYWDQVARSVAEMPNQYVSIAFRSQSEASWYDLRQRALIDALADHPFARRLQFADPLHFVEPAAAKATEPTWDHG